MANGTSPCKTLDLAPTRALSITRHSRLELFSDLQLYSTKKEDGGAKRSKRCREEEALEEAKNKDRRYIHIYDASCKRVTANTLRNSLVLERKRQRCLQRKKCYSGSPRYKRKLSS